ncbi:MAG: hypothetical protein AAFO07_28285, partial [Bacteroidota bacterium]
MELEWREFKTIFGTIVRYQDYSISEYEQILSVLNLEREKKWDTEDSIGFIEKENGYVIERYLDLSIAIFYSITDYLSYKKHFEIIASKKEKTGAFPYNDGTFIQYKIKDLEESEIENLHQSETHRSFIIGDYKRKKATKTNYEKNWKVFERKSDLDLFLDQIDRSIVFGLKGFDKDVLLNKNQFILNSFIKKLKLSEKDLDFSPESLQLIDSKLSEVGFNDIWFYHLYLGMIFYLGEVVICSDDERYEWGLEVIENEFFIPILLDIKKERRRIPIHIYLFESLKAEYF